MNILVIKICGSGRPAPAMIPASPRPHLLLSPARVEREASRWRGDEDDGAP